MTGYSPSESTNRRPHDAPGPGNFRALGLTLLQAHPGLFLALVLYLGLAFAYFFITPIFEAPDEWTHTGHVKFIAQGNGLPVMLPGQGIFGGQQPPLYYTIGALLVQPFELNSFETYLQSRANPHASLGYALDPGNKNNFLHTPAENFPYQGLSLTVHILRLYSMVYGIVTLVFIYLTALELFWPGDGNFKNREIINAGPTGSSQVFASLVAVFVAAQPMFAFITASVANEPANMAFCAVGLWLTQRYILYGPTPYVGRAVALGLVLGLISLSKMTGLAFGLVAATAFLIVSVTTRKHQGMARLLWRDGLIITVLFLAVGGWWYWRNYQLYGDFFQRGLYKIYFNIEQQPLSLADFLYTLATGEISFWATFGWLNIVAPEWVYSFYRLISRLGLLGVVLAAALPLARRLFDNLAAWRQNGSEPQQTLADTPSFMLHPLAFSLHLVFPLALAFSLTRLVAIEGGLQGRQLLPALGSIAIIIMGGWWMLSPARLRRPILLTMLVLLLGIAAWLPFGVVAPAYTATPLLTEAELPVDLPRLNLTYRDELKLVAAKIGADSVRPGERVPVTVYWQALKPMTTNYSVFVHLVGRNYQNVGQFNTYPGLGLRPTRSLEPGQIVVDTYPVQVAGGALAPARLLVNVGLFHFNEPGRPGIEALGPEGQPASSTVGQLKLIPAAWPSLPAAPPVAEFTDPASAGANRIVLTGYTIIGCQTPTPDCEITFKWLAQGTFSTDYTVFIQLWPSDSRQNFIGFDAPPLAGDYPTSLWASGEVILDAHELDLSLVPPGNYQVWAGLYHLPTGQRLLASTAGTPLPDNAINLGILQIR